MAQVPNKVYPMASFNEITALKFNITDIKASGVITGSRLVLSTISTSVPSGTMTNGEVVFLTGASGTSATGYIALPSGSGRCIYSFTLTYVSPI